MYALAALQLVNIALLVRLFAAQDLLSFDFLVAHIVVGASSGYSIITAHELIHRRNAFEQRLGRALLCSVLYEHFYTEHLRGHHLRVATAGGPGDGALRRELPALLPAHGARPVPRAPGASRRSAWATRRCRTSIRACCAAACSTAS